VGLLSITPCQIRRGTDQAGFSASGFSQTVAQSRASGVCSMPIVIP
jgi:hypothetical protein